MLASLRHLAHRRVDRRHRFDNLHRSLRLEALENRCLLSITATGGYVLHEITRVPFTDATVATFVDPTGTGNASDYSATIDWGDGLTSPGKITQTTVIGGKVDVLFLTDSTISMSKYISNIQSAFNGIQTAISSALPGIDIQYAVADYKDYADGGDYQTYGVKIDQGFTSSTTAIQTALNGLSASGGNDWPEENLTALPAIANNWLTTSGALALKGRSDAQKLIIWAGDQPGHYYGETGADGPPTFYPSLSATLSALNSAGVKVIGLDTAAQHLGIDESYPASTPPQYQEEYITNGTGGTALYSVGSGGTPVNNAVINSIVSTVSATYTVQGDHTYATADGSPYSIGIAVHRAGIADATASSSAIVTDNPAAITLTQATNEELVGKSHTVTATLADQFGDPAANVLISFQVLSGPNAGAEATGDTARPQDSPTPTARCNLPIQATDYRAQILLSHNSPMAPDN